LFVFILLSGGWIGHRSLVLLDFLDILRRNPRLRLRLLRIEEEPPRQLPESPQSLNDGNPMWLANVLGLKSARHCERFGGFR
jgi:hypothetical protein